MSADCESVGSASLSTLMGPRKRRTHMTFHTQYVALLLFRAKNSGLPFRLMADVDGVGGFDDIVLTLHPSSAQWRTVVFRHSPPNSNMRDILNSGKLDTYVKTCHQISKINAYFKWKPFNAFHFVVLTKATKDGVDGLIPRKFPKEFDFLKLGNESESILSLSEDYNWLPDKSNKRRKVPKEFDFLKLGNESKPILSLSEDYNWLPDKSNERRKFQKEFDFLKLGNESESNLSLSEDYNWRPDKSNERRRKEFLNKFTIVSGLPDKQTMDYIAIKDIMKALKISPQRAKIVWKVFMKSVENWFESSEEALDESSEIQEAMFGEDLKDDELPVELAWKESSLLDLQRVFSSEATSLLHVIIDPNMTSLTHAIVCKVLTALRGGGQFYLTADLDSLESRLNEWTESSTHNHLLVVVVSEHEDVAELLLQICRELNRNHRKQVVLLSHNGFAEQCSNHLGDKYRQVAGTFAFDELSPGQLQELLSVTVNFQGFQVDKKSLVSSKLSEVTDPELMEFVLKDEDRSHDICIGLSLPERSKEYIARHLHKWHYIKKSIFESEALKDKYAVSFETDERRKLRDTFIALNRGDEEEHFRQLCKLHPRLHWLHQTDEHLTWRKSYGGIGELVDYFQVTGDRQHIFTIEDREVVITGQTGLGLSTFILITACDIKQADPSHWVVHVAVTDYCQHFNSDDFDPSAVFISMACRDDEMTKHVFQHVLDSTGNISVLFDGADELPEKCWYNFNRLCHYLSQTTIRRLWVSIGNFRFNLPTDMQLTVFTLSRLTKQEQQSLKSVFYNEFEYAQQLLELFNDENLDFTSIPRQIKIISDILEVDKEKNKRRISSRTYAISILFEKFIYCLFEEAYRRKYKHMSNDWLHNQEFREVASDQHKAAAVHLLGDASLMDEQTTRLYDTFQKAVRKRHEMVGLVDRIINDKPNFVHIVYAEYFFSLWLAEHYDNCTVFIGEHLYKPKFQTVRIFFDQRLCKDHKLHVAVLHGNPDKVRKYLETEDVDGKDHGGRTALHVASALNYDEFKIGKRLEIVELLLEKGVKILSKDNVLKGTAFSYADKVGAYDVINLLLINMTSPEIIDDLVETGKSLQNKTTLGHFVEKGFKSIIDFLLRYMVIEKEKVKRELPFLLLCKSAEMNQIEIMKCLTDLDGTVLRKSCMSSLNALHAASRSGHGDVVEFILDKLSGDETCINKPDEQGLTALLFGARSGSVEVVRTLIAAGGDLRARSKTQSTALILAADYGHLSMVKYIHQHWPGDDWATFLEDRNTSGNTALYLAARRGLEDIVTFLVDIGANLEVKNNKNFTILHGAAYSGNLQLVRIILNKIQENAPGNSDAKAEFVKCCAKKGELALHVAAMKGHTQVMEELCRYGVDVLTRDHFKQMPLHYAAEAGSLSTLEFVVDSLQSEEKVTEVVNTPDAQGDSALQVAAFSGQLAMVQALVAKGGDLSRGDPRGRTLLHVAAEMGYPELAGYLLEQPALVNRRDNEGRTPLHYVMRTGDEELIKHFLDKGASV